MDDSSITDPISLSTFLDEWIQSTFTSDLLSCKLDIDKTMSVHCSAIGNKLNSNLIQSCSYDQLLYGNSNKQRLELADSIPEDSTLLSHINQQKELVKRKNSSLYKKNILNQQKYKQRDDPWRHRLYNAEPTKSLITKEPDVLLHVVFHRIYPKKKILVIEQEFDVLGQTLLTSLRDMLECRSDHISLHDYSKNPDIPVTGEKTKDYYKSGFFFIEGTFYNDMRFSENIDYSETINNWARERPGKVGPFKTALMDDTKFIDLTLRIGQPYLYMHQGDCEHLIIFSDLRIKMAEECIYIDKYPIQTYKCGQRGTSCRVCQLNTTRWITFNSPYTPEDPCYFCHTCLKALHYDIDGNFHSENDNTKVYLVPEVDFPLFQINELT